MGEELWYYVKDGKQQGPVPESVLQELLDSGHLGAGDLVWSKSLKEWTAASDVESLRVRPAPAPPPPPSGEPPKPWPGQEERPQIENSSGTGKSATIPPEIQRWNWGAFFFNWIWGIGNKTYIALLALIPFVGIVMVFVLGAKGSKWAWQNKRWSGIEHFKDVQRLWAIVGLIFFGIYLIGIIAAIAIPNFMAYQKKAITSEAKQELGIIRTLEATYNADNNTYGSLSSIGWVVAPTGKTRYTYSLEYSTTTFTATATGNLDRDATLDIWTINEMNILSHISDDIKK